MVPYYEGTTSYSDDRAVALRIMQQIIKEAVVVANDIEKVNGGHCSSLYQIKEKEQKIQASCNKLRTILLQGSL